MSVLQGDKAIFKPKSALSFDELQSVPGLARATQTARQLLPGDLSPLHKRQWKEQIYVNFPLLYLGSILLHRYAQKRGITNFLFATRDCVHFVRIFSRLFPQYTTHYFHCSRNICAVASCPERHPYDDYVEKLLLTADGLRGSRAQQLHAAMDKTVFVDIHGSGRGILQYFTAKYQTAPFVYVLTGRFSGVEDMYPICREYAAEGKLMMQIWNCLGGSPIEMLNYDVIGTLQNFSERGPVRDPLEYKLKYVQPYHDCMDVICRGLKPFSDKVDSKMARYVSGLLGKVCQVIQLDLPIIAQLIKPVRKHPANP